MKKKRILPLVILFALILSACNKDQKVIQTLSGTWTLVKLNGVAIPEADQEITYTFDECKLKDNDYCELTISDSESTQKDLYQVKDDGETLVQRTSFEQFNLELPYKILELTDVLLKMELDINNTVTSFELEKQ